MTIHRPMTPLRRRMLEDMQIRNYSPHTIDGYLRYVAQFAKHFHRSPDLLDAEHIRTYQLHLLHTQVVTFHAQRVVIFTNYWVKPHKGTRSVIASDLEDKFSEIDRFLCRFSSKKDIDIAPIFLAEKVVLRCFH